MRARRGAGLRISDRLRASAVIGIGLLIALAATAGPLPSPGGNPGASLAIVLPDAIRMLVLGLLALSGLILLAVQRPRRRTAEPTPPSKAQRLPAWAAALLPMLLFLSPPAVWYVITHYGSDHDRHSIENAFAAIAELLELLSLSRKPPTSVPFLDATVGALLVVVAAAIFAVMIAVAMSERLERWWTGWRASGGATAAAELAEPPGDLRAEPDARAAIIRAYGRFERALAAARAPRAPWETPAEFARATTARRVPVPAASVERLTALFEIARFSNRALGTPARDSACDCLDEIVAALEEHAAREQ